MAPKVRAPKAAGKSPAAPKAKGKAAAGKAAADNGDGGSGGGEPTLRGAAVVFTGELDGLTRDQVMDKVKAAGAKVMSGISGSTTFLIVGSHLDDGRAVEETSKYRKYLEMKAKGGKCPQALREPELLALLGATNDHAAPAASKPAVVQRTFSTATEESEPWVERHKPKSLDELLGNASAVKKLTSWLRDWDDVVLRGRSKPVAFKPGGGVPDNVNARAVLLSGPPGIGKTTASRLVAKQLGWDKVLEFNASDARSQKIINSMADGLADNRTLSFGGSSSSSLSASSVTPALTTRCVIIMDEIDGMGAGDRGGNAALIKMIKKTKNPIICISNDHSSPKVRSLAFSCYDIKFTRPMKSTIAQRVAQIAASEGLGAEPNALEALAESCGNDIRHVLNQLQVMSKLPQFQHVEVGYTDMKDRLKDIAKDGSIMLNPFDACRNLLTASIVQKMPMRERYDHFFVDINLMHLMVQENYLNSVIKKPVDDDLLQRCARAAESIANGDIVNERIRSHQAWNLLPDMGLLSTIYPTFLTNGFVSFPEFPKFLGNYSKMSRARRLTSELHAFLKLSSDVEARGLASSGFLEVLFSRILKHLQDEDIIGATAIMDAYGLQRDHVAEHLNELMQHLNGEDAFKLVDPKIKSAMTREMNSGSHAVRVFLPPAKKKRASAPEGDDLGEEGEKDAPSKNEGEGAGEGVEDAKAEQEDDTLGGLVRRAKAKRGEKAKAKARAKASAAEPAGQNRRSQGSAASVSQEPPAGKAKASAKIKAEPKGKAAAKAKADAKGKAKARGAEPPAKRARK
mmetsp:Transcript_113041/g.359152  ORF Transcript_113041/g.359152 Transcript_113041/m.359152 type:complete len:798 (+) Transcript_113041:38-2431(+)